MIDIFDRGEFMDIRNLISFVHVAEMNSFTKAADFLGYSQSTVSFQIKQLETEFGCQLFERINHTVTLTQKGRELLEYAHKINKLTDEVKENMTNENAVNGSLHIATADSLCAPLIKGHFSSFCEKHPAISIKLTCAGTDEMFRMLDCNEADAIITLDSHIYNTDYIVAKEEKVAVHFVASPALIKNPEKIKKISDLLSYPFILTEKNMSYRRLLDVQLARMYCEIKPVLEIGSAEVIAEIVAQGTAVSLLPDYIVREKVEKGELIILNVEDIEIEIWKQLLYHRRKWVSKQLSLFVEHFCNFSQKNTA